MALAVQQSLFKVGGEAPIVEAARWGEGVMLGEIALGLCVIAVALVGALLLTGRLPLREGMRVVLGCFVLLGAPVIAAGFVEGRGPMIGVLKPKLNITQLEYSTRPLPPPAFDGSAGASVRDD